MIASCSKTSKLFLSPEAGDAKPHQCFANHNFSEAHEGVADIEIDILARGAGHGDYAANIKREDVAKGHHAAIKLDANVDAKIRDRFDLFAGRHTIRAIVSCSRVFAVVTTLALAS